MKSLVKKFLCVVVSVMLILCSLCLGTFGANGATASYILGDTDLDGEISINDVSLLQKHLAKLDTLDETQQYLADVDGNAGLSIKDVTVAQIYIVKLDFVYSQNDLGLYIGDEVDFVDGVPAKPTEPTTEPTTAEPTTANDPTAVLDSCTGAYKSVSVKGWAFDADDLDTAIEVHVYIGGTAGIGEGHAIVANTSRPDVNGAYACGDNHGFEATISTNMVGTQPVYFYAINIEGGENVLFGHVEVTIPGDFTWDSDGVMEAAAYQNSTSSVQVDFDGEYGATRYCVRGYTDSALSNLFYQNDWVSDAGVSVEGLSSSTTYYFTVQAYNDAGAITAESEYCKVYIMPNYAVKYGSVKMTIQNLPCERRVIQNFWYDTTTNILYVTQATPVFDSSGNFLREDTVLARCPVNGTVATCDSFMLIKSGGHGTILNGYYTVNNELMFYVGAAYNQTLEQITAVARIPYNTAYANTYNPSTGLWYSYDGTQISYQHKPKNSGYTGSELTGAGYCNDGIGLSNRRLTGIQNLVPSGGTFMRFDYKRCGGTGYHYIIMKYKNSSGTIKVRVIQINTNIDSKLASASVAATSISTTTLTTVNGSQAFFNGNWQSSGIYDVSTATSPQWFISGNIGNYGIQFKDMKNNKVHTAIANKSGFQRGEQETEGVQFVNGELWYGHKFVDFSTGTRVLTIQSIPMT